MENDEIDDELDKIRHDARHKQMDDTCDECRQKMLDDLIDKVCAELDGHDIEDGILFVANLASVIISMAPIKNRMELFGLLTHATAHIMNEDTEDEQEDLPPPTLN